MSPRLALEAVTLALVLILSPLFNIHYFVPLEGVTGADADHDGGGASYHSGDSKTPYRANSMGRRALDGVRIVLDPGHGYYYDSSTGQWSWQRDENWGLREDLNNVDLAIALRDVLETYTGAEVYSTRELNKSAGIGESGLPMWEEGAYQYLKDKCDYDPGSTINLNDDLLIRPYYANYIGADIYISLHSNADTDTETGDPATGHSAGSSTWRGFYTIYGTAMDGSSPDPKDRCLGDNIHPALADAIGTEMPDRGEAQDIHLSGFTLAVLRETDMPAVLFELGFHDNLTDTLLLSDPEFRHAAAMGIMNGILAYFQHPLQGRTIALDPGHGGSDPGAVGYDGNGYPNEKDVTLDIGLKLRDMLLATGANVVMTRESDMDVSLSERCSIANNAGADIFISIHCNSGEESANGTETIYYDSSSIPNPETSALRYTLALSIQTSLVGVLNTTDLGVWGDTEYYGYHLYVLANTNMPAALAKVAFISNPEEFTALSQDNYRTLAAEGLYNGILRGYYHAPEPRNDTQDPGVIISWPRNGEVVGGTMNVRIDAWDDTGVRAVKLRVDNGTWLEDLTPPYIVGVDTERYAIGPHTLHVMAVDAYGRSNNTSVNIRIERNIALKKHGGRAYGGGNPDGLIDDIDTLSSYAYSTWNSTPRRNLTVVLPHSMGVTLIKTHLWDGDGRYYQYRIMASDDNVTWYEVSNRTEGEWRGWVEDYVNTTCTYLRFVGSYSSQGADVRVTELQVYSFGAEVLSELRLNASVLKRITQGVGDDTEPFLYEAVNGTLYLVWVRHYSTYSHILASLSTDGGATWKGERVIYAQDQYILHNPSIAESKDGTHLILVYNSTRDGASGIYAIISQDGGATWGSERAILVGNDYRHPRIYRTEYGTFWLVYDRLVEGRRGVYYVYSVDNGLTWGAEQVLSTGNGNYTEPYNQQFNESGSLYLWALWCTDESGNYGIYYKKSVTWDDWSLGGWVNNSPTQEVNPTATLTSNGTVLVGFVREKEHGSEIYLAASYDGGGNWTPARRAIEIYTSGINTDPSLYTTTAGVTLMAWSSDLYGGRDIFISRNISALQGHLPEVSLVSPRQGEWIYNNTVVLKWEGSDEDGDNILYDVYLGTSPYFLERYGANLTSTTLAVSGLQNHTLYYWTVVPHVPWEGYGTCLNGTWSFYVVESAENHPPESVGAIDIENLHSRRPVISWPQALDPDGHDVHYEVFISIARKESAIGSGWVGVENTTTTATFYVPKSDLDFGREYMVGVRPKDEFGLAGEWATAEFTLINHPPEVVPISPQNGSILGASGINLQWYGSDEDADPIVYDVYIARNISALFLVPYASNLTNTTLYADLKDNGTYYWCVVARDVYGASNLGHVWEFIVNASAGPLRPRAVISGEAIGTEGERMFFDASQSYDPDGIIVEYTWEFGDNSTASGIYVSHIFSQSGIYNVSLTVKDMSNLTATAMMAVVIYNSSEFNGTNLPPIAKIYMPYLDRAFPIGQSLVFSALGSYDPDGTILRYEWEFGDGTRASGGVVSHAYMSEGQYRVKLEVWDEAGAYGIDLMDIEIYYVGWAWTSLHAGPYDLSIYGYHPLNISMRLENYTGHYGVLGPVLNISAQNAIYTEAWLTVNISAIQFPDAMNSTYVELWRIYNDNVSVMEAEYNATARTISARLTEIGGLYCLGGNYNPVPKITSADCSCVIGESGTTELYTGTRLRLTAFMSYDPDGMVVNYTWVITPGNLRFYGMDFSYIFEHSGEYRVVLWVTDGRGAANSTNITVKVLQRHSPGPSEEELEERRQEENNAGVIFTAGVIILIAAIFFSIGTVAFIVFARKRMLESMTVRGHRRVGGKGEGSGQNMGNGGEGKGGSKTEGNGGKEGEAVGSGKEGEGGRDEGGNADMSRPLMSHKP